MENNKNVNRTDDDQLRDKTTNELLRQETGNTDLNNLSEDTRQQAGNNLTTGSEDLHGTDLTQGVSYNPNDASAVRSGGTTDMDDQAAGGAGLAGGERRGAGSGITTKRNVTGSDFDGQDATS